MNDLLDVFSNVPTTNANQEEQKQDDPFAASNKPLAPSGMVNPAQNQMDFLNQFYTQNNNQQQQ